ncbi:MAG TPA: peptidylprolyl isomerase [Gemmatimonadaceae bacterium]|jgi:peptidyl-prolyl cis-trans isomerase D
MRFRSIAGVAVACTAVAACSGLKDALTAHVDVVARAGSQELSVNRLGDLLGNAKIQVPVTKENAAIVADLWAGYEQVGYAAAHNDSLSDKKSIDAAFAPLINQQKLNRYMDSISKTFKVDSASETTYNQAAGGLLAARHILIGFKNPGVPGTAAEKDSLRKRAQEIRAQVTPANFTDLAKKFSTDPTAAQNGGNLGIFPAGQMIQPFYDATKALKPGEISQPVETQFGFHIIQRLPYADAAKDYQAQYAPMAKHIADSAYVANLESTSSVQVKDNAAASVKEAAKEPSKHRNDKGTLATFKGGDLTIADFLSWVDAVPPQQQILQRIPQAADSELKPFVKQVAMQQLLLKQANDAKVDIPAEMRTNLYSSVSQLVLQVWQQLGVDPKMLADSAKSTAEREKMAAGRVDAYLEKMMGGQAQVLNVPPPLKKMLDSKYESSVNSQGVDRAVERAQKLRASSDSARAASQPKSAVPMPGMPGMAPPPGGEAPPPGAMQPPAPQPNTPPAAKKTP